LKVLALDYGSARTGVAVSDPTGTVARPLCVVEPSIDRIRGLVAEEEAERVIVGLPLTLRGERGAQAEETERFVEELRAALDVPVETFDERFTTVLAGALGWKPRRQSRQGPARKPGAPEARESDDARAAAHLLSSYLEWASRRT
jgi:putative holliday junction resolvase